MDECKNPSNSGRVLRCAYIHNLFVQTQKEKTMRNSEAKLLPYSLEVYPVADPNGWRHIYRVIESYRDAYEVDWVSVTCSNRKLGPGPTIELAGAIQRDLGIPATPHITGRGRSPDEVKRLLERIDKLRLTHVLALRGDDPPRPDDAFATGAELIRFVKGVAPQLKIGGACYPGGHPDSDDLKDEFVAVADKIDAGAEFLVSQFVLEPKKIWFFQRVMHKLGLKTPLNVGLLPALCSPERIEQLARRCRVKQTGQYDFGTWISLQIEALLSGAQSVHLYTLNEPHYKPAN